MYEGKNKTALRSQQRIAEGLLKLIDEKPLEDISINEIAKTTRISRQTFYSLFETKRNAVAYAVKHKYPLVIAEGDESPSFDDICRAVTDYLVENRALLGMLFANNMDSIVYEILKDALSECDVIIPAQQEHRAELITSYTAGGLNAIARRYTHEQPNTAAGVIERSCAFLISAKSHTYLQRL